MLPRKHRFAVYAMLGLGICCWALGERTNATDYFWVGGTGDWMTGSNWDQGLAPEAQFEEVGVINNGGIATLSSAAIDAAGLDLGRAFGESGTMQVLSGGSIVYVDSTGAPVGHANIGTAGTGILEVHGGGVFRTTQLKVSTLSEVWVGQGAGIASLTSTGTMRLAGKTTVRGPGHLFLAAQNITLSNAGVFVADITSAMHSPLSSGASISLGGELQVKFSEGFIASPGDSWSLFDASSFTGSFSNIDLSALPDLTTGLEYQLNTVAGGGQGQVLQLELVQIQEPLRLSVNPATGMVLMASPSGESREIAAYSILSSQSLLDVAGWNSLEDQAVAGWQEASPSSMALNEITTNSASGLVVDATGISLGAAYNGPLQFGDQPDLQFEYVTNDNETVIGSVEYTGPLSANNMLLTVDPLTGEAVLSNSSTFAIALTEYSILSATNSLLPDDLDWSSLEDQSLGNWEEAVATTGELSELWSGDAELLSPGASFSLGGLFDEASGVQDIILEFQLDDEASFRTGVVKYATLVTSGDFDDDGDVDGADFLAWQRGLSPRPLSQADLAVWQVDFGSTNSLRPALNAVPEPTSLGLACFALVAGMCVRRRGLAQFRATLLIDAKRNAMKICKPICFNATAAVFAISCFLAPAYSASLPVVNHSFEEPEAGGAFVVGVPDGWTSSLGDAGTVFVESSSSVGFTGGDLLQYGGSDSGYIYQDLGVVFEPNKTYTVELATAHRGGLAHAQVEWGLFTSNSIGVDLGTAGFADLNGVWSGSFNPDADNVFNTLRDGATLATIGGGSLGRQYQFSTGSNVPSGNVVIFIRNQSSVIKRVNYDNVRVDISAGGAGDVDLDGDVDLEDHAIIRDHFRMDVASRTLGDLTFDGRVDFDDYIAWRENAPAPILVLLDGIAVPEPSSFFLVATGFGSLFFFSSRVHRNKPPFLIRSNKCLSLKL